MNPSCSREEMMGGSAYGAWGRRSWQENFQPFRFDTTRRTAVILSGGRFVLTRKGHFLRHGGIHHEISSSRMAQSCWERSSAETVHSRFRSLRMPWRTAYVWRALQKKML